MKTPFSIFRKWWRSAARRSVPFWHVTAKVAGAVHGDEGEVFHEAVKVSAGKVAVKVPDQTIVQVHSRGPNE